MPLVLPDEPLAAELLASLSPRRWLSTPNGGDRAELLGEVLERLVDMSELPSLELDFIHPAGAKRGRYLHDEGKVLMVRTSVAHRLPTRALGTLIHEHRHAVQYHCTDARTAPENLAALWQYGRSRYDEDKAAGRHGTNVLELDAYLTQFSVLTSYWEWSYRPEHH